MHFDTNLAAGPMLAPFPTDLSGRLQLLLLSTLKDASLKSYVAALENLKTDSDQAGVSWERLSELQRDIFLAELIAEKSESPGEHVSRYTVLLAALHKISPHQRYRVALKSIEAWRASLPVRQAPAMPTALNRAIAALSLCLGEVAFAALALLCHSGMLRVGEALSLMTRDVILDANARIVILLHVSKRGSQEQVVVTCPHLHALLSSLVRQRSLDDPLFGLSYYRVLKLLRAAALTLGLDSFGFTTHSWRRGGASEAMAAGAPVEDICVRGRWASLSSARLYIRKGEVFLNEFRAKLAGKSWETVVGLGRCLPRTIQIALCKKKP